MWPFKSKVRTRKFVAFTFAGEYVEKRVYQYANQLIISGYGSDFVLGKSRDGEDGNLLYVSGGLAGRYWRPVSGWTNAELREYGFNVPSDDGIVPQEVQLARAVLAGDKAAAAALADWVTEHWGSK